MATPIICDVCGETKHEDEFRKKYRIPVFLLRDIKVNIEFSDCEDEPIDICRKCGAKAVKKAGEKLEKSIHLSEVK